MNLHERVVVTGLGAVSALGLGAGPLFAGALAGRSGIRPWAAGDCTWVAAPVAGELGITVLALARGVCPPTAHLEDADVEGINLVSGTPRSGPVQAALSNTFAFGGSNVSLAVRQYRAAG